MTIGHVSLREYTYDVSHHKNVGGLASSSSDQSVDLFNRLAASLNIRQHGNLKVLYTKRLVSVLETDGV
jgi:hypothetical protein